MNRLLILLCMAGWALYVVHTNANRGDDLLAQNPKVSQELSPTIHAPAASIQSELQPIAATAVKSPHAIIPDEMPRQVPPNAPASAQQMQTGATSLPEVGQHSTGQEASSQAPDEQLRVTSETTIRSGPSDSSQLIGRAHRGATLRVKSREAGWVQFVDPIANETGWISMAYLEHPDAMGNTSRLSKSGKLRTPRLTPKEAKLKATKPPTVMRRILPTYAQLPADREFVPPRRGGLFGMFWRRRFSDLPPP